MFELLMLTALFGLTLWPLLASRQAPARNRLVDPAQSQRERRR